MLQPPPPLLSRIPHRCLQDLPIGLAYGLDVACKSGPSALTHCMTRDSGELCNRGEQWELRDSLKNKFRVKIKKKNKIKKKKRNGATTSDPLLRFGKFISPGTSTEFQGCHQGCLKYRCIYNSPIHLSIFLHIHIIYHMYRI